MTTNSLRFRDYFSQLGWLAIFTLPCRMFDSMATKDDRICELESELKIREAQYNVEIENLRKGFIDRELARMNFKPIYHKPETPPPTATGQRTTASIVDRARADLRSELQPPKTDRAESFQESLKKIQDGAAAN